VKERAEERAKERGERREGGIREIRVLKAVRIKCSAL
jgi:hypothetical protein